MGDRQCVCPLLVTGRECPLRAPEGAASSDEGDSDELTVVSVVFSSWHVEGINIDSSSEMNTMIPTPFSWSKGSASKGQAKIETHYRADDKEKDDTLPALSASHQPKMQQNKGAQTGCRRVLWCGSIARQAREAGAVPSLP